MQALLYCDRAHVRSSNSPRINFRPNVKNSVDHDFDPVTLEIFWSRLISIADESAAALLRTSFSTIVRESNDFATVLMDRERRLARREHRRHPVVRRHPAAHQRKTFWSASRPTTWQPGDCVITNDPWLATGHLPDITMAAPIFHRGALVGFCGLDRAFARHRRLAVVGRLPRAVRGGPAHPAGAFPARRARRIDDLIDFILANVRVPDQVLGDLEAQVTAQRSVRAAAGRIPRRCRHERSAPDSRTPLQARAERAMRRAIEAVPDGELPGERSMPTASSRADDAHRLRGRRRAAPTMHVDYAGTSPQIDRGINCVMNYTTPIRSIRSNARSIRSRRATKAPIGSITRRRAGGQHPQPALSGAGQRAPAHRASAGRRHLPRARRSHSRRGASPNAAARPRCARCSAASTATATASRQVLFATGGMGAARAPRRPSTHGVSDQCRRRQHRGVREHRAAHRLAEAAAPGFRAAPGSFRGGLGQEIGDRGRARPSRCGSRCCPTGTNTRRSGSLGGARRRAGRDRVRATAHARIRSRAPPSRPGDAADACVYAGGGGYGDPRDARSRRARAARPARRLHHVRGGARRIYGLEL